MIRRGLSRPALWGLAALLLSLVAGVWIGEASGWPLLRGPLERQLAHAAGVPVTLAGGWHLRLLGRPRLEVEQLTVGAASGVPAPHLIHAQKVHLEARWRDLLRWRNGTQPLRVRALRAAMLDAQLVRLADGRASWQLGRPDARASEAAQALPRIDTLAVGSGRIAVDDRIRDTRLRIDLHGGEGEGAAANGYQARVEGVYHGSAVRGVAFAGAFMPLLQAEDEASAPAIALRAEGNVGASHVAFDGEATALFSAHRLRGALQLRGPSLAAIGDPLGVTLPQTPPFDLAGELRHDAGLWQLRADRASIGRSRLAGDFSYDRRRTPPLLAGQLKGPRLALQDLGRAIGTGAQTTAAGGGRVLPQRRFDLPSLRAMDADVQVAIDELDFGSAAVAPMRGLRTRVRLERGVLQLQALQASVAGGQVAGSTQLDGTGDPAHWAADLRFDNLDIAAWIRALRPTGAPPSAAVSRQALRQQREQARASEAQPLRSYLTGALGATLKVQGTGRSTAEILASLGGRAQLRLREGTLSHLVTELLGIDVAQAVGVVLRGDQPLALRCAVLDLALENGVAVVRRGVLDNRDSTIRIDGRIDLRDEALALRASTRPKDMSPLALRTPVLVTGTLADPVLGIEGTRVAGRLLLAAALGAVAGPAGLLPLVDRGYRDTVDPCGEAPAAAPASAPR